MAWKNKKNTSNLTSMHGTWKDHWINKTSKDWPKLCSVKGCSNSAEVGAHIYRVGLPTQVLIVPMCKSCNGKDIEFELKMGSNPVDA